jgi:hypothetical protein
MNHDTVIQILEALASGCAPSTGELLDKDSILNDRNVIRALQIAINQLKIHNYVETTNIEISQMDIDDVIELFKEQQKKPTPHNFTGFFLGTRLFKNQNLISNKLYGKFSDIYTKGQLIDFFSKYFAANNLETKYNFKDAPKKRIDFFEKEIFNNLTPNGINQLKEKINELGILKTEKLTDNIQAARKIHKRAFERWSNKEKELLSKAIRYTNDLSFLSTYFQRGESSIESMVEKLISESKITTDKN